MKKRMILLLAAIFLVCSASVSFAATYYLSTSGSDLYTGNSETAAWKTFAKAFSTMRAGDALILLNGKYSASNGTGYMNYNDGSCSACAQPPSGISMYYQTFISAKNPGMVTVDGGTREGLWIGRSYAKSSYIRIEGIKFEGGGKLYNTSYVTLKGCGFHSARQGSGSVFALGTSEHSAGNSYNLIEDCWIWGKERIIAINYRADNNVWRRVVIRGDGCSSGSCTGSGNPNVGFSIYDSKNNSIQNMVIIDRILGGGSPYANFATAQHTDGSYLLGPNEWLGCISLNSPDSGFNFEADNANANTHTLRNVISWNSAETGVNIGANANNITLENITTGITGTGSDTLRVAPGVSSGAVRNIIALKSGRFGINSAVTPVYCDVYGSADSTYNQASCTTGCKTSNALTDGSLKYIARIEAGSALKGTGYNGGDYGANVIYRYGLEGSRYGDADYNTLTTAYLWPWNNEARIKADMAVDSARGFCDPNSTLTTYVWGQLGNSGGYTDYGTAQPPSTTTPPATTTASPVVTTAPPATTIPPTTTPPTTTPAPTTTTPPTTTPAPTTTGWTFCSSENAICNFSGTRTVRYGANNTYVSKIFTGSIACNNATFGDPIYGTVKHCDYQNTVTSTSAPTTTTPPTTTPAPVVTTTPPTTTAPPWWSWWKWWRK
jgi:hypothetical protein